MWSFYIPSMVCVLLACLYLLRRYAAPGVHWFARALVLAGWLTSISIVALVPIDVWATLQHAQGRSLSVLWSISYWSTQALTWVLIPLSSGYFDAGDRTFLGRLRQSVKDRVIYFSVLGVLGLLVVGVLLLTGELRFGEVLPWAMVLSNTYGLVAGLLLLGYGLVAIPRQLWQLAPPEAGLRWALHRVGRTADSLAEAAREVQRVATVVEATSRSMSARDPLRPFMDAIYAQAQAQAPIKPSQAARDSAGRVNLDELSERDLDYGADEAGLAALRRRLTHTVWRVDGLRSQYGAAVADALRLERVCKLRRSQGAAAAAAGGGRAAWAWQLARCWAVPWLQRLLAVLLAATSFALVWSEATLGSGRSPDLSPFSHAIGRGAHGEVATQLLAAAPLAYMCGAAYYSLFKLVIFSYYRMVPAATDPVSLLLNAGQVARFAAPLAYNFMHVIRMNERTVFAAKMAGAMEDVTLPFFGADFNTWFPLTAALYCLLLYLNVWDAVAGACLPRRFRFSEDSGDDRHTERGRQLLQAEQDAAAMGLPVGACLGLWGAADAPEARSLVLTQLPGSAGAAASSARTAAKEQPKASPGWAPWRGAAAQPVPEAKGGVSLSLSPASSRPASRRPSQSGGAKGGSSLEDIFARLEPDAGDRLGRVDDDSTPLTSLAQGLPSDGGFLGRWR